MPTDAKGSMSEPGRDDGEDNEFPVRHLIYMIIATLIIGIAVFALIPVLT